jgi:hypothetical protein
LELYVVSIGARTSGDCCRQTHIAPWVVAIVSTVDWRLNVRKGVQKVGNRVVVVVSCREHQILGVLWCLSEPTGHAWTTTSHTKATARDIDNRVSCAQAKVGGSEAYCKRVGCILSILRQHQDFVCLLFIPHEGLQAHLSLIPLHMGEHYCTSGHFISITTTHMTLSKTPTTMQCIHTDPNNQAC